MGRQVIAGRLLDASDDGLAQGAARHCQLQVDGHFVRRPLLGFRAKAVVDGLTFDGGDLQAHDHAQIGDAAAEFGVDDGAQTGHHIIVDCLAEFAFPS